MTTLLTYVSSEGLNPFTGETFPEGHAVMRTVGEIYMLLSQGFTVENVEGNNSIPLNITEFYHQFKKEIDGKPLKKNDK